MQFLDKVKITLESWKWWDGCVSGRREAGVPYGGPSWWNGWRGGSIILEASKDINTLLAFKYRKIHKALDGEPWRSKEQYGANAEDLILKVPVGTLVTDANNGNILHYFSTDKEKYAVLHGGVGWLGNIEFKTPTLQYPSFAILWEPWQVADIELELQLMWDVALVGSPSVGKSTIINALANTKAKVADYHFTTLIPHLGSVKSGDFSFNIVDIPGLIKWASEGKWLWNQFLRHVLKAKIFCIIMDMYNFDKGIQEWVDLLLELFSFIQNKLHEEQRLNITIWADKDALLLNVRKWDIWVEENLFMQKQIMFAFNKFDLIQDEEIVQEYINTFKVDIRKLKFNDKIFFKKIDDDILNKNIFVISAATHQNLDKMTSFRVNRLEHRAFCEYIPEDGAKRIWYHEDNIETILLTDITEQERALLLTEGYLEEDDLKFSKVRYADDRELCKLVYTTQRGNDEAEMRFWSKLDQNGYIEMFKEFWARKGDVLKVKSYYPGYEDRFIQW